MLFQKINTGSRDRFWRQVLFVFIGSLFTVQWSFAQYNIPQKPDVQTSVYDQVGLLTMAQKKALEQRLIRYSDTTSTQIVVAIIPSTKGENIGLLAPRWAQQWGIGQAKEDNGVFVLLSQGDRKIWIAPGYGVEHKLTAGITGQLIRDVIIPEFKKGAYYKGLDNGVTAIFQLLNGTYKAKQKPRTSQPEAPVGLMIILGLFFIVLLISISKNNKRRDDDHHGGNKRMDARGLFEAIILSNMGRRDYGERSSRGGWGGSSGGGFGGFGGGFGGGGFSGGGAGGSW